MIDFETKKVLFIDLDSTLIKTISGKTFPEDITDFRVQLPVLDKIIEKMPNLSMFFIVSNQGGLKTLTDKRIFNYKIWAVEGICHGYFINKLNNFPGTIIYSKIPIIINTANIVYIVFLSNVKLNICNTSSFYLCIISYLF